MIFARKINKIPAFYMIFARKMPESYIVVAREIFFPEFLRGTCPRPLRLWIRLEKNLWKGARGNGCGKNLAEGLQGNQTPQHYKHSLKSVFKYCIKFRLTSTFLLHLIDYSRLYVSSWSARCRPDTNHQLNVNVIPFSNLENVHWHMKLPPIMIDVVYSSSDQQQICTWSKNKTANDNIKLWARRNSFQVRIFAQQYS